MQEYWRTMRSDLGGGVMKELEEIEADVIVSSADLKRDDDFMRL